MQNLSLSPAKLFLVPSVEMGNDLNKKAGKAGEEGVVAVSQMTVGCSKILSKKTAVAVAYESGNSDQATIKMACRRYYYEREGEGCKAAKHLYQAMCCWPWEVAN